MTPSTTSSLTRPPLSPLKSLQRFYVAQVFKIRERMMFHGRSSRAPPLPCSKLETQTGLDADRDMNDGILMKVQGQLFSLRECRVLCDAIGTPIISMKEKVWGEEHVQWARFARTLALVAGLRAGQ